ncbi:nucleic-acid-binding protein from transposon X-element [Trichonephila clavata]|uniref:Nucleic-acid-binding protein from transposon X-element n=1 Tax=Trichonephila clavata TaxID=2740835 RepID=A0A8X6HWY3_TRICU|nr:nucleic-acid-binding protein from transposon X-element [Trichonephila clavata]
MTRQKQQRPTHLDDPEKGASSPRKADMNSHDIQNPPGEDEMMQLGTDPPPTATTSDAFERCAQIKKLIKMKQLKIRYFTDMIEVETFDKDVTDAAELESLIKEKAKAELEFAIQMDSQIANPAKKTKQESKIVIHKTSNENILNDNVILTSNAFVGLGLDETDSADNDVSIEDTLPAPKVKPITLRFKTNHNLVLKAINEKFPDSNNKLVGEYIKIIAPTEDDHRTITAYLKQNKEEFFVVPHTSNRPLKVVIKGLPASTSIDGIKADLAEQGVPVSKVAQLTQRKSKFPLPIFMVEIKTKTGPAAENRNGSKKPENEITEAKKVTPNLTFAKAVNSDQQRSARNDKPEPAKTNTKPDTVKNQEENSTTGFISAMSEFRKLFQRFPGLLEAGKALKNAKSDEEMLDIYMGVMASTVTPQPSP